MRKVRTGEIVAGASAVLLLIVMFLDWYEINAFESFAPLSGAIDAGVNAWQAFGMIDLLLAIVVPSGSPRSCRSSSAAARRCRSRSR